MNIPLQLIILLLCLLAQALFAGMETGIISLNHVRLQHMLRKKISGARELEHFLHRPELLLGTTLVGTNLFMVIASVLAASIAIELLGPAGSWISTIIMTLVVLIFAEYLPKAWFQSNPAQRARHWSRLLLYFGYLFYPVSQAVLFLSKLVFPIRTKGHKRENVMVTREELRVLTTETERTGGLSFTEREMIHRVFDLDRKSCREIMTPVHSIVSVPVTMPRTELIQRARAAGFNRYPVYSGSRNNIVGLLHVLEAATDRQREHTTAADYMRPPQFTSEDTPPDDLLPRMRQSHEPVVFIKNSHDHVIGLVTIEDVLQEIIGKQQ